MMERADHSTNEGLSEAHDEDCDNDDDDDDIGDNVWETHDADDDDGINAESDTMR